MKKIVTLLLSLILLSSCTSVSTTVKDVFNGLLENRKQAQRKKDIVITDLDGTYYSFVYDGEEFLARYDEDNWCIYDSYRITDEDAIYSIVEALSAIHPIHSKDYTGYRTVEDMAGEWLMHNLAYRILKDDPVYRERARNVDLDPEDEGLSLEEFLKRK